MGLESIDVSRFVTGGSIIKNNNDEKQDNGENLLKAFASMVNGAEVMDGDLRLSEDGHKIEKVNYGSVRLFGNRSVKPSDNDNIKVRNLLRDAVDGYLDKVETTIGKDGSRSWVTPEKLESLRRQCSDLIGGKLSDVDDGRDQNRQLKPGAKPLSRRTVNQIIQLIDDAVNAKSEELHTMQSKMIGRRTQAKMYGCTPWRLVGGEKGMRMARAHFETMFAEALDVAAKKNPAYRPAFEAQIAHYKKLFDENRTGGELEIYFTGSLDADTIAEKMFQRIEAGIVPEIAGDHRRKSLTGAAGREMHDKITNLRVLREQVGEIRLTEKADVSAIRPQNQPVQGAEEASVKNCVSELLLNKDLEELEWCGFEGGERLGRVLYRNLDVLNRALENVRERAAAGKARTGLLAMLANVSPRLADEMEKLLARLDAKVFKGQAATKASFFASSQAVFKAIADAKLEDAINSCLREALKEHDVPGRILAALRMAGNGNELTFIAVRSGIEDADDVTLRRMFASGLSGDGFSYGGILKGLGPYALKLMQGLDESKINEGKSPLHAEIRKTLNEIKSQLPPLDADVIMADLLDYVGSNETIESIKVDKLLSAASIGQSMTCTLRTRDGKEKTAIYKLQRPAAGDELRREMAKIGALINRIASGEERRFMTADIARVREAHQVNIDEILPECDFINESTNALMGLKAYGQPPKEDDTREVKFSTSNDKFEVKTKNLFGSEQLVLRPEFDNDDGRTEAMAAIRSCVTREDFQGEVKNYFLPATSNSLFVEIADGKDMAEVLGELNRALEAALSKPADEAKGELLDIKDKFCKAFEAMLQLSAEFVHSALVDPSHFMHCDLHLGNLMYDEDSGRITAIDYGRAGQMPEGTAAALHEIMMIGRDGGLRLESDEDRKSCGERLVNLYRQMLQSGAEAISPEVQRALERISTPDNRNKLAEALVAAFGNKGNCTVGNVLDKFVEALSTVPELRGLPIPKEVASFRSAYNRLQSSVQQLQDQIAKINQKLATCQSAAYTDADLDRLGTTFGPGGDFELQNLGYPEVEVQFDDNDRTKWTFKVTVSDGRLGVSNGKKDFHKEDGSTGFQGTGKGATSSMVLARMIETAKKSQDARQRFAALSTILQILGEEERRLEAFNLEQCFKDVDNMKGDLSITKEYAEAHKVEVWSMFKNTSFEFFMNDEGNKSPSKQALAKIREEKTKILAAMETLKPHCSKKSLYVNSNVQSEALHLVAADQTAIQFERPAVSSVDIVLGATMSVVRQKSAQGIIPYIPARVDERYQTVKDNVSTWGEFLAPEKMHDFRQYSKAVNDQTISAKDLKDFSFYDLRNDLKVEAIDADEPWGEDESVRELTKAERETYIKFRQVAAEDLRLDLPPISEPVTRADYRKLLADIDKKLNIQDLDELLQFHKIDVDGAEYTEEARTAQENNLNSLPEVKKLRALRSEKLPMPEELDGIDLYEQALEAYKKLEAEIVLKGAAWKRVDSPTALDYVRAFDRLCALKLRNPADLADAVKNIEKLSRPPNYEAADESQEEGGENSEYTVEDALSLPEYLEYARQVEAKNLEIQQRNDGQNEEISFARVPTYGDFLELLPPDLTTLELSDYDLDVFNELMDQAIAYQVPGAMDIKKRVKGKVVVCQDYLDLREVVQTAKEKWDLGGQRLNALNNMARIVKQMPFTMPMATFESNNLESCAMFVKKVMSFNKAMFVTQKEDQGDVVQHRDKDSLYKKIGEFNGKLENANQQIDLPSKEEWDKLSFFEVRAYLDEYLRRAYPDRDIAKALAANNCDRASQPLNEEELAAYQELENLAIKYSLPLPPQQPAGPNAPVPDMAPKTHRDLKKLYDTVEQWRQKIPTLDGGNGFDILVGGAL